MAAQTRRIAKAPDFKLALAHPIKPKGGPGVLLVTLEDAVRFIGLMKPWRQARPYWDHCASGLLKAPKTGKRADIVEATRCLEVALRRDNWALTMPREGAIIFRDLVGKLGVASH